MSGSAWGSTGDPPEVCKRRLRAILRDSREAAKLTQQEAANRVLWSLSKLIRVENGPSAPVPADARMLMLEYAAEEERIADAVELAKRARQPDRWDAYKSVLSKESINLFASEKAARVVLKQEPSFVPGLFQTEDYARALLRALEVDRQRIDQIVMARIERQELLESRECPGLQFVLGEAAVSRPVGGSEVMCAQIEHLTELAKRPSVTLRLMPFSSGAYSGMGMAFTILQFKVPELPDLLYLESGDSETVIRDDLDVVDKYVRRFAQIQELALSPEDSIALVREIANRRLGT